MVKHIRAGGDLKLHANRTIVQDLVLGDDTKSATSGGAVALFTENTSSPTIPAGTVSLANVGGDLELECDADKTLELKQTVWEDLRIPVTSTKVGGNAPGFDVFKGAVKTYAFDKATDEELHFNVQLPHSWKQGTTIKPHVHWAPIDTEEGSVMWKLEYTWANVNGTFGDTATVEGKQAGGGTAYKHQLAPLEDIAGTGKTISSMLVCRLYRDVTDEDDYDNDAALLEIDFHYEVDTLGSRAELSK